LPITNVFINQRHLGGCDDTFKAHSFIKLIDMVKMKFDYDLIVIGGGSGGLAASKQASALGMKVAVCDFVKPTPIGTTWGLGGTCVNVGCIPKKLMHHASILGELMKDAESFGWDVKADEVKMQWNKLVEGVQSHIGSLNWGYRVQLREKKVDYVNGYAEFIDQHTIKTTNKRKKETKMTANKFIIAVGERPRYLDIPGGKDLCVTSDDLFSLPYCPGKTLVVGASYVALECAGFLKGIGLDVTVMVRSIFLRGFDQQMANKVGDYMEAKGVKFLKQYVPTKIERVSEGEPGTVRVTAFSEGKGEYVEEFNTVLVAVGRESTTTTIGLENIGLKPGKNGKIVTDDSDQTSVPNVYCIGDNAMGKPELTPVAIQAGRLLSKRLFGKSTVKCDYDTVPTTVFTPLEYSCCGLSEESALEKYGEDNIEVYHSNNWPLEWTVAGHDSNTCYAKVIALIPENERIVGIHYLGPNAGEVMQGFAAAMKAGMTKETLDATIGIHPTTAEILTTLTVTKRSAGDIDQAGC
jgi:thioredoxin reductase (NADPH)